MHILSQLKTAASLVAVLTTFCKAIEYDLHGSYFVLNSHGNGIVSERLDPVIFPGQVPSPHVHDVHGGGGFAADWDYDKAIASDCNNMGPKKDHSNYWYPALYHHSADGQYTKVPSTLGIYYHFDTADNGPRTMFNHSQRIIAGNPMLRHDDSATNKATKSIQWWCHGPPSGEDPKKMGAFPEGVTSCGKPYGWPGFSAEIWFPFCSDLSDEEFDPAEPNKHIVYGEGDSPQGGKCPTTHPHALPQLFMEFHFNIEQFKDVAKAEQPWVLAPGDPTGSGFHADFINGWEDGEGSLGDAIAVNPSDSTKTKCFQGEVPPGADACFEMHDDATKEACKVQPSQTEDVEGPFSSLPGCNPEQAGPQDATVQTDCAGYTGPQKVAGSQNASPSGQGGSSNVQPASQMASQTVPKSTNMPMPSGSSSSSEEETSAAGGNPASIAVANGESWVYHGCYSDLVPDRSIRALDTWGRGSTSTDCAKHCVGAGFSIAGTEMGDQCFCGNALKQSKKIDDGQCSMQCKGSTETCGGSSALSVYAKQGTNLGLKKRSHVHRHLEVHPHAGSR